MITEADFKKAKTIEEKKNLLTMIATKKAVWKETIELQQVNEPHPFQDDLDQF